MLHRGPMKPSLHAPRDGMHVALPGGWVFLRDTMTR